MRQNAAQLNRMQIREQEALNRQRRLQDDAAARREQQAVRRTQAQYDHVASRGYGRSDAAAGTPDGRTAGASSSHGPAGAGSSAKRSGVNANVAHGDDVQIKVYVRECDGDAGHVFTYREGGPATATATASGAAGGARAPRGTGGPSTAAASSSPPTGGRQAGSGGVTRGPGIGAASKADGLVAPNRARVPHYLQQRKAEMAAEKEALAAEAERQRQLSQIPPGHRRVSEEEKADTLRCLDERQQELETQLAKIPIRFDTQSIQQRRRAIEDELRELEAKRNKYSTKNPFKMDVRAELVHLYTTYNPKRLKDVDALLERFKGREHVILKSLREKYAKSSGAAAARRANESLLTNPSLLLANASSVMGDTNEASGVASVGSAAGGFESLPPPSHRVPALKPVTPSAPLAHLLSSSSLASSRVLPQGHHDSSTAAVEVPGGAAATTHRPPPPPSAPLPTSPFLFRNGAAASSTCTSAARLAEMQELIRQMTLLDVRQLAVRVGELTRPPANGEGRVPQLQWRQGHSGNRSSLTAPAGEARGDVSEVLQHTSVFVDFFATCARRYVALAQEEQAYLETQRQRALPRGRAATSAGGNAAALHEGEGSGGSAPKEDSSPPLHPLPTHNTVARSFAEGGSNHNSVAHTPDYQRNGHHQTNTSPLPPPKDDERTSAAAAAARERSGASPPSPSVRCDRKAAASCVRNMRHVCSASPLSTNDVGSPPACRTTTVSPLTSPDDISASPERRRRQSDEGELFASSEPPRRSRGLSHTPPSPPPPLPVSPPPPAPSGKTLREPTLRRDHIHMSSSSMRSEGLSTPPPPSPPSQPAPDALGQLTMTRAACHKAKRVLHWAPVDNQGNRYGPLCATLEAGDCVVLQPGVYYENLHLEHRGRVEFTSAYPGAAVVLQPFSDLEPVLSVSGARTQVELTGVVLVQGGVDNNNEEEKRRDNSHRLSAGVGHGGRGEGHGRVALDKPSVPLLLVRDGAGVSATACHFYGGTGGGVVAAGQHTRLRLDLCLISLCSFAGVYIHGGASASILQSKMKRSEVGLRVLQGSFSVSETSFEGNRSDGIVLYEESMGVLERSNVLNNGGNGIFLSRGTELRVVASVIELNAFYGVQRARGSTLHVKSSFVRDNGLLPINEELA